MITTEICYGVIVIYSKENKNKFLLLQHNDKKKEGSWSFPKGHREVGESPIETALRELREETGIKKVDIINSPLIYEEYEIKKSRRTHLKKNGYFIGYVSDEKVKIQKSEIHAYKWALLEEAFITFLPFQKTRVVALKEAQKYLEEYKK